VKEPEIRCPKCAWKPTAESRWSCTSDCGTQWNTFWTAGVCPGCSKQWYETQCLACHKRSPHKDWYHFPDDEDQTLEERQADKVDA
jgi:hypothetical protein